MVGRRGERGPTGDHGQDGERGIQGERGPTNRLALIGYLILTVAVAGSLYQNSRHTRQIAEATALVCRISNENRETLRQLLQDAAARVATSRQRSAEEKREAAAFYRAALDRIPPDPCPPEKIGEVLS